MPSYEYRNGEMVEVPDLVLTESGELHGDISRTVFVEPNATVTAFGVLSGTVVVRPGAKFEARNAVSGTVNVSPHAQATFHARTSGTLNVARGGLATLLSSAVALGTMNIDGTLVNEGTRGTVTNGSGVIDDRDGSAVRQPDNVLPDGTAVYYG